MPAIQYLKNILIILLIMSHDLDDKLGHGTAICSILNKVQNCEILMDGELIKTTSKLVVCTDPRGVSKY